MSGPLITNSVSGCVINIPLVKSLFLLIEEEGVLDGDAKSEYDKVSVRDGTWLEG